MSCEKNMLPTCQAACELGRSLEIQFFLSWHPHRVGFSEMQLPLSHIGLSHRLLKLTNKLLVYQIRISQDYVFAGKVLDYKLLQYSLDFSR